MQAFDSMHSWDGFKFGDQRMEVIRIRDDNLDLSFEDPITRFKAHGPHVYAHICGDDVSHGMNKPDIVNACKPNAYFELRDCLARPIRFHHAVGVAGKEVRGVGAVAAVDFDSTADGDEPKDVVTGNRIAARGEAVVEGLLRVANQ